MSAALRVRAVAFDLGSVLVDVHKHELATHLGRPADAVEAAFFAGERHTDLNRGALSAEAYLADVATRLDLAPPDVERAWRVFVVPRPGVAELVARVRVPVAAWSNIDAVHADALVPQLPARLFERGVLSCEVRLAKPDPRFFELALARLGHAAADVLFLDDREENVAAAAALGVHAVRVDTLSAVADALTSAGVLEET